MKKLLSACILSILACCLVCSAQLPVASGARLDFGQSVSSGLAQQGELRQCCRCCFGARQEKDCVDIMEVNKCRNRGGVCTNVFPCFGRD